MDKTEVVIATMTWARDDAEEHLLRDSLQHLAGLGIPIFVTDGGSPQEFRDFLQGSPNVYVLQPNGSGVWPQVWRSIQAASESAGRFILYAEPDKRDFFRTGVRQFIAQAPSTDDVGVVLASRSAESFATFPAFQRSTETAINRCCAELLGPHVDYTYGPFLLNRRLVPHLLDLPDEIAWGWRPYTFGTAHRLGLRIEYLEQDVPCPPEQRHDDRTERIYRMRQLTQNIQGLIRSPAANAPRA